MSKINVKPVDVASKKQVGKVGTNPVLEIVTTGGLWMNVLGKGGSFEILSTGPHRAVARYIAEKKAPDIQWTDLHKGDYIPYEDFAYLLPEFEAYTDALRARRPTINVGE